MSASTKYEVVIGLEIHAQMNTKTKLFCRCDNDSFNKKPNSNICPICLGYPGQLPILNAKAIEKGILTGLALNCEIAESSKFDRKQYFYPDLPAGFQISQYDEPLCLNGRIEIPLESGTKNIGITRIHLENDAGKLTHTKFGTLCDYNRAGTPLMEIVSEPDMRTIEEASNYAREIQKIVRYVGTSDADMEKGHMRFDINVSLRPIGQKEFGTKVEIKNLNSFTALEKALEYEIKRQAAMLDAGEEISQETRGWDEAKLETQSQRSKEQAHDYRYFPEPDLPPIILTKDEIASYKDQIPELPRAKFLRFVNDFQLSEEDARILTAEYAKAHYFETVESIVKDAKLAVSFINTILTKKLSDDELNFATSPISAEHLGELLALVKNGTISNNQAKSEVIDEMYKTGDNAQTVIARLGIKQVSNTDELKQYITEAMAELPQAVEDYKAGKERALGSIVGKVMQKTKGQANPALVNQLVLEMLK